MSWKKSLPRAAWWTIVVAGNLVGYALLVLGLLTAPDDVRQEVLGTVLMEGVPWHVLLIAAGVFLAVVQAGRSALHSGQDAEPELVHGQTEVISVKALSDLLQLFDERTERLRALEPPRTTTPSGSEPASITISQWWLEYDVSMHCRDLLEVWDTTMSHLPDHRRRYRELLEDEPDLDHYRNKFLDACETLEAVTPSTPSAESQQALRAWAVAFQEFERVAVKVVSRDCPPLWHGKTGPRLRRVRAEHPRVVKGLELARMSGTLGDVGGEVAARLDIDRLVWTRFDESHMRGVEKAAEQGRELKPLPAPPPRRELDYELHRVTQSVREGGRRDPRAGK